MRSFETPHVTEITWEEYMSRRRPATHNDHHTFYFRRNYRRDYEKRFRNHRGLIIREFEVEAHKELHHDLFYGPPKPNKTQMQEVVQMLDGIKDRSNPLWGVLATQAYFESQTDERSQVIAEHLTQQLGYVVLKGATCES